MKSAFPAVFFTEDELNLAREFTVSMMKFNQNDRPPVPEIKTHPFLLNLPERNEWKNSKTENEENVKKESTTEGAEKKPSNNHHAENISTCKKSNLLPVILKSKEMKKGANNPLLEQCIDKKMKYETYMNQVPQMNNLKESSEKENAKVTGQLPEIAENTHMIEEEIEDLQQSRDVKVRKFFPGRIRDWFKIKWNKVQKPNKYVSTNTFFYSNISF